MYLHELEHKNGNFGIVAKHMCEETVNNNMSLVCIVRVSPPLNIPKYIHYILMDCRHMIIYRQPNTIAFDLNVHQPSRNDWRLAHLFR